jgi:glycosidase
MRKFKTLFAILLTISILVGCTSGTNTKENPPISTSSVLSQDIGVCYSLFPIAFADSDGNGMGDINGIREKLQYLKNDLGVDCIWLNPVHPSPTYHKYDVIDYLAIDPVFGTMEDYENLIKEMHELDMYLIMDFVINHTSSKHPWFQAAKQKDETYRDYYRWLTKDQLKDHHMKSDWHIGGNTYYYGGFWSEMPELNLENEKVRDELKAIAEFWLNKGVDGFRIDAAKHLYDKAEYPEGYNALDANISFLNELSAHIKSINENAFIISEVLINYKSASVYYEGTEALFNFDIGETLLNAAYVGSKDLADTMQYYIEQMEQFDNRVMGTFLSNHDQNRSIEALARSHSRAKVAANLLLTLPGLPFIYYGEEIGMIGKKPDEDIREPFVWGDNSSYNTDWNPFFKNLNENTPSLEEQMADDDSLFNNYKNMIKVRKDNPVLAYGGISHVETGIKAIIAYTMFDNETKLLVVHNTLDQEMSLKLNAASEVKILYAQNENSSLVNGTLELAGRSVIIIDLLNNDSITME